MNLALRIFKAALVFIFCAGFLLVAFAELIEVQRVHPLGLSRIAVLFVRHVLLVSGILPLIVGLIWVARFHSPREFWVGGLVLALMVVLHFWVFAVSAHSDVGYVWAQLVEAFAFGGAVWFLIRGLGVGRGGSYGTRPSAHA